MAASGPGWDPHKVYDISTEERKLIEERARMRAGLKAEWQKKLTNPQKPGNSFVFDPAVQRWFATRSGGYQYFKPTPYSALLSLGIVFLPPLIIYKLVVKDKNEQEDLIRSGQIAYKDRRHRFLT